MRISRIIANAFTVRNISWRYRQAARASLHCACPIDTATITNHSRSSIRENDSIIVFTTKIHLIPCLSRVFLAESRRVIHCKTHYNTKNESARRGCKRFTTTRRGTRSLPTFLSLLGSDRTCVSVFIGEDKRMMDQPAR